MAGASDGPRGPTAGSDRSGPGVTSDHSGPSAGSDQSGPSAGSDQSGPSAGSDRSGPTDSGEKSAPADRGVSEFTGVAILIAVTVLVTASVGLSVVVVDSSSDGERTANFTFQYIERSSVLIISFDRGDQFAAGNLTVRGDGEDITWAALSGTEPGTPIGPASPDSTVQLSARSAYGRRVSGDENVAVIYKPGTGNETVLQRWDGN